MKLHTIFFSGVLALVIATPVALGGAGAMTVAPATKAVTVGQTFTMTVVVDPATTAYTTKAVISYPAALLEVKGFAFASQWLPLTQSGYDSIDNASGTLTKTAGYPGGLSTATALGTITFKAKATGAATIQVGSGAMLLNASNANELNSRGAVTVTITAPVPTATPAATSLAVVSSNPTPSVEPITDNEQVAAIGGISGLLDSVQSLDWYWWLLGIGVLALLYRFWRRLRG